MEGIQNDIKLVESLRGQAKRALLDLMRELCKNCPHFEEDVSDPSCSSCPWKAKEKLIRVFVE